MALAAPREPELVTDIGPISGKVIKNILSEAHEPVNSEETKVVKTGISVNVNQHSIIFVTQFTPKSQADYYHEDNLQIKHMVFEEQEVKNLTLHVYNPTSTPIIPSEEPLSFYVYALPLKPIIPPDLTLYPSGSGKKHNPARAQATVEAFTGGWHSRINVKDLLWTQHESRWIQNGIFYTTSFIVNTYPMPIRFLNTARELVCSLREARVTKLRLVDKDKGLVKIYLESLLQETPKTTAFVHLAWEQGDATLTMSRNPKPFLTPQERNGYTILSPRRIHIRAQRIAHVLIDIYFESERYIGIICPKNIPGVSISCNPVMPAQPIFLEIRSMHKNVDIKQWQPLASLHFIDRKLLFSPRKVERVHMDQFRITAKLEYHNFYDAHPRDEDTSSSSSSSSSSPDSPITIKSHSSSSSSSETESEDEMEVFHPPAPVPSTSQGAMPKLSSIIRRKRFAESRTTTDSDDDDADKQFPVLYWPIWKCGIRGADLTPIVACVHGDQLPLQEFKWDAHDDWRRFYGLSGSWQSLHVPRRRRPPPAEEPPSPADDDPNTKKHCP
ncbi:tegument protein pp71 [Mandrillus leucophaeus cytomegalovirus]|uniref:Tegument protein pp71 n=1 Tax=Mandrillus leucophaeus cytomegalovirus TaxID=1654930 RepID=A0A0G2UGJ4_9BETA|nr:tegument protein pp71 [Mandrillus leucophaeus cytomegalovirus]AKI29765.1 tegument protein pp71 [Mandrillus leucophaeus cytomegalovirus]